MNLRDIQSWWEIPCIAHFCSLFSDTLDLPQFDIEDLEQALLNDGPDASDNDDDTATAAVTKLTTTNGQPPASVVATQPNLLPDLIVRLVNGCNHANAKSKFVTASNYQMYLRRLFRQKCEEYNYENTFNEDIDFHSLPLRTKVRTLHRLCDFRLDALDVQPSFLQLEAESLRVDPLGCDARGATYWYFYGTRLYREDAPVKVRRTANDQKPSSAKFRTETAWQVVCSTVDDWNQLVGKFEASTQRNEIALYQKLRDDFLPDIRGLFVKREQLKQRAILFANIRRSNRVVKPRLLYEPESRSATTSPTNFAEKSISNIDNTHIDRSATPTDQSTTTDDEDRVFGSELDESSGTRRSLRKSQQSRHRARQFSKFTCASPSLSSSSERSSVSTNTNDLLFQSSTTGRQQTATHPYIVQCRSDTDDSTTSSTAFNLSHRHDVRNATQPDTNALEDRRSSGEVQTKHEDNKENQDNEESDTDDTSDNIKVYTKMAPTKTIPPPKVQGRRTNNSLSSLTENIFIPMPIVSVKTDPPAPPDKHRSSEKTKAMRPPPSAIGESSPEKMSSPSPPPPPPKKKKGKSGDVPPSLTKSSTTLPNNNSTEKSTVLTNATTLSFTETEEVLQIGMHKVLEHVKAHKDAWPFVDPVEEDIAPRYYTIIRRPMDLLKMEEKLDNGEYQTFTDFRNDFKLIVNNCRLYNGQNNEYTVMVNHLQGAFEKATKKYFESNSSDDERNAEYPDLKTNVFREKNFNSKNVVTPKAALLNELAATKLKDASLDSSQTSTSTSSKSSAKPSTIKPKATATEPDQDATTTTSPRGTKRKRKDKDKRRKKKAKLGSGSKATSGDEEDDEEIEETVLPVVPVAAVSAPPPALSASKAEKNRLLFEEEDDDAWEYDKPPKHLRKKKKNTAGSKKTAAQNKYKSKALKEKVEAKAKESPSKRKQKISKKKTYSSEEDQLVTDEDPDRENQRRSKNESVPPKPTQRKKSVDKSKSSTKVSKLIEKAGHSTKRRNDSISSSDNEKNDKTASKKAPERKQSKVPSDNEDDVERSISSDDALFDFPISPKARSTEKAKRPNKQHKSKEQPKKRNSETTKSKRKSDPKESKKSRNQPPNRERTPSPVHSHRSRSHSPSTTSSRSNSPAVFTVDLHKKYSQSASRLALTPTKHKSKLGKADLMSVSSGSRGSSPTPSLDSSTIASTQPTNHERKNVPPLSTRSPSPELPPSPVSLARPVTPEIRNKYDLIKERRSRVDADKSIKAVKEVEKIKEQDKGLVPSTSRKLSGTSAAPSTNPIKNNALSETIEKLKANSKSSKKRTALLSEILLFKKASEVRTEKEILEKLNAKSAKSPRKTEAKKKKVTPKKEPPKIPAAVDEYNFVDDLLIDPPASAIPVPVAKEPPPAKSAKTAGPKKPRAKKGDAVLVVASTPSAPPPKATNLEALELETEQTLKDINRWLEHTPRFDFNSASNSPSRYNILYDFDDVSSKLEEEFQRPIVPSLTTSETLEPIAIPISSSLDLKNPSASEPIVPTSPVAATKVPEPIPIASPPSCVSSSPKPNPPSTSSTPTPTTPVTTHKTTQLIGMMPAPGSQKREAKEKKKALKEKSAGSSKRKEASSSKDGTTTATQHRGIDRLQPGKSKGNLLGTPKNEDHPADGGSASASGTSGTNSTSSLATKPKEVKNSLMQPESETGPKLSLGSVLDTSGFGLGNQHNFGDDDDDDQGDIKEKDIIAATVDDVTKNSDDMDLEEIITTTDLHKKELEKFLIKENDPKSSPNDSSKSSSATTSSGKDDKKSDSKAPEKPTPNLNAWFKAFGAPKKSKKAEEEEAAATAAAASKKATEDSEAEVVKNAETYNSPQATEDISSLSSGFQLPAPRTNRKASTGSTMSERSSYSQDPDSPRMGIDERLGGVGGIYPSAFPSPLSASPLTSPKDDTPKTISPYPMNGALKVGFYQDTITKSSPEKSCSPREQPPTYSTYAQHLYSSATASIPGSASYGNSMGIGCSYTATNSTAEAQPPQASNQLGFNHSNKTPSYYDQYKQPRSQDSDYNSSMSPNPNSPYQQQLQSPYQQPGAASPYQQPAQQRTPTQHSPYHQPQPDGAAATSAAVANSPGFPGPNSPGFPGANSPGFPGANSPGFPGPNSPGFHAPNSPYHQQNSPYAQPNSPVAAANLFTNPSPAAGDQPFSPSSTPGESTVAPQQSPFHSNPTSPYSPHQPQSPYQTKPVQSPMMEGSFNATNIAGSQDTNKNVPPIGVDQSGIGTNPVSPITQKDDRTTQSQPISPVQQPNQQSPVQSITEPNPPIQNIEHSWPSQMPAMFNAMNSRPEPVLDESKPLSGSQLQSLDTPKKMLDQTSTLSAMNTIASSSSSMSTTNPMNPAGNTMMGILGQPYGGMNMDQNHSQQMVQQQTSQVNQQHPPQVNQQQTPQANQQHTPQGNQQPPQHQQQQQQYSLSENKHQTQQMLHQHPYSAIPESKPQQQIQPLQSHQQPQAHQQQATHQQHQQYHSSHMLQSHHQHSMPNLHPPPPSAHNPYLQTYSNPYMDRHTDSSSALHQHLSNHAPKHGYHQTQPSTTPTPQLTHPALHTPTLSLPPGFDDSNSSAGSMPKPKSQSSGDKSNESETRSLETPRPQQQQPNHGSADLQKNHQMYDQIMGPMVSSFNGAATNNLPPKRGGTSVTDISTSKAYDMFNRAAMGFGATTKPFGSSITAPPTTSGTTHQHSTHSSAVPNKPSATSELVKMASNLMPDIQHYTRPPVPSSKTDTSSMMNMGYTGPSSDPASLKAMDKALNMSSGSNTANNSPLASMYQSHHMHPTSAPAVVTPANPGDTTQSSQSHQHPHHNLNHHQQHLQHQQQSLHQQHHQMHLQHQMMSGYGSSSSSAAPSSTPSSSNNQLSGSSKVSAPELSIPNPNAGSHQQQQHMQQAHQPQQHQLQQHLSGHHPHHGADKLQPSPYELNVPRYDMSGRQLPATGMDPFKPFTPSSSGNPSQLMMDAHTASMRSILNMDATSASMQQPPTNTAPSYYSSATSNSAATSKDMPPAAHMFSSKSSSMSAMMSASQSTANSNQSNSTANLHQMLNNTMTMAYNATREQQQHHMHHQQQQQQQHQSNAYGQHHQATAAPSTTVPAAAPVPETKPKRTRKKKAPAAAAVPTKQDTMQSQMLQQQQQQQQQQQLMQQQSQSSHQQHQHHIHAQQGFQSYSHLKTSSTGKGSPNPTQSEPNAISLKTSANSGSSSGISATASSVPGMVPGSAFNFGPSGTGLGGLYGAPDGAPSYLEDYRNTTNPYYMPPAHRNTPDLTGGSGSDKNPSSAAAAAAAAAVAATSVAAGGPSSYHQFLARGSPYGFMGGAPSLDPNAQIYQSAQMRQMLLGQGILGHSAPGGYVIPPGYHPAMSMHKSPYDPMAQMNRPPWFQ